MRGSRRDRMLSRMDITRRHRFATELPQGFQTKPIKQRSDRRDAILKAFTPDHQFLPSHYLSLFVGGSHQNNQREFTRMCWNMPRLLTKPQEQENSKNADYKHLVYQRTAAGATYVGQANPHWKRQDYAHQLLDSLFMASLKIEAAAHDLKLLTWDDIIVHDKFAGDGNYGHIKLSDSVLQPDGRPFILTKSGRSICFLREIDRNTEPLDPTSDRPSIAGKLKQYREFMDGRYYKRIGFHNCMVIILTTRPLDGVVKLAGRIFEGRPPSWLLLQRTEDWAYARHFPNTDGTVPKSEATFRSLTTPYRRVGHAPFSLQQLMEVPNDPEAPQATA